MSMRNLLTTIGFGLLFSSAVMAQGKLADEADDAFNKGFYYSAIELYKKAYTAEKKATTKAELIFKVAESYRALGDMEQAASWYDRANRAQYPEPITYFWIGEALKQQGKYKEAIEAYERYKEKKPADMRADAGIAAAQMAMKWQEEPTRYSVAPEVMLNTPQMDFSPAYGDLSNSTVVFGSTRPSSTGTETDQITGESFSDLFTTTRDRLGKWSEPVKLPSHHNTFGNEGAPAFNSKRTLMYFTRCPMEKKAMHGCDIWVSRKVGNEYTEPEKLDLKPDAGKNDTTSVGHPAIGPNDDVLVFASNGALRGGQGGRDLYAVRLNAEGRPVGSPVNLGPDINTGKDEVFPFIRQDGSLYFSSNGHMGMGGLDIFRAVPTGDLTWGQVENVRAPLNSAWDDFGIIFDAENDRGHFTSNRPGGKGMDDIWRFHMPAMEFALQGTVYDKLSGEVIPNAKVTVAGNDGSNFSAMTDENGGFSFAENGADRFIQENTTYSILAEAQGYLVVKDQITTVGLSESTTFVKEYFLQPARADIVIKLPEVQYDLGKYTLRPEGKDSLQVLYQTLIDNPTIIIELAAHTDSRGSDASNMTLSQNRAQSCVNYLVTLGIDPARMVPKGYGESRLRISDAQIAAMKTNEEREAAHQQNRRTEFRVLSWDYVPKENGNEPAPSN